MTKQSRGPTRVSTHPLENGERTCESTQSINQLMGDLEQRETLECFEIDRQCPANPNFPINNYYRFSIRKSTLLSSMLIGRDIDIDISGRELPFIHFAVFWKTGKDESNA